MTLLSAEVHSLQVANKVFSKYYRVKKTYIYQGDVLIIEDTQDIITQRDTGKQVQYNKYIVRSNQREGQ